MAIAYVFRAGGRDYKAAEIGTEVVEHTRRMMPV
jgi:hypothetical protein